MVLYGLKFLFESKPWRLPAQIRFVSFAGGTEVPFVGMIWIAMGRL